MYDLHHVILTVSGAVSSYILDEDKMHGHCPEVHVITTARLPLADHAQEDEQQTSNCGKCSAARAGRAQLPSSFPVAVLGGSLDV
jgi:hypothetical protein